MGSTLPSSDDDHNSENNKLKPANPQTKLKELHEWPTIDIAVPRATGNQIELESCSSNILASNMYKHKDKVVVVLRTVGRDKSILKYYHKHAGAIMDSFRRESEVASQLAKLNNPHLAKILVAAFEAQRPDPQHGKQILEVGLHPEQEYFIVTIQYCNQRDLTKYLELTMKLPEFQNLDCHEFLLCCYDQILYGLEELWIHEFVHQDIKPDNIFLDYQEKEGFKFKLGDFGSTLYTKIQKEYPINVLPKVYTPEYQPPETVAKEYYPMPQGPEPEAHESSLLFPDVFKSEIQKAQQLNVSQTYSAGGPGSIFGDANRPANLVQPKHPSRTELINSIQVGPIEDSSEWSILKMQPTELKVPTAKELAAPPVIPVVQITPKLDIYSFGKTLLWLYTKLHELSRGKDDPWAAPSPIAKDHFEAMASPVTEYDPVTCIGRLPIDRLRLTVFGVTATARGLRHLHHYKNQFENLYKFKLRPVLKFVRSVRSTIKADLMGDDLPNKGAEYQILWSLFVGLVCLHCEKVLLRDLEAAQQAASKVSPDSLHLFDIKNLVFADLSTNSRSRSQRYKLTEPDPILSKAKKFLEESYRHGISSNHFSTTEELSLLQHLQEVVPMCWRVQDLLADKHKSQLLRLYVQRAAAQQNSGEAV